MLIKQYWREMNEWLKAFVLAIVLLMFLHVFVVRWVIVESSSMYATLRPGDLVLVQRWPVWTGFTRGDVVVFRDPMKNNVVMARRPLLVKRIVGMPGDVVELRRGKLFVNNKAVPFPAQVTFAYLVRLRDKKDAQALLDFLGLPMELVQPGRSMVEVPLNTLLAKRVRELPYVISAEPMGSAIGAPRHVFPFSQQYTWNSDNFGPVIVPKKGDAIAINVRNLPMYDRLMSVYEGHHLEVVDNELQLDGSPLDRYVFEQDHYFVLGDSRHHSADSRYWGFLPDDHVTGRAGLLLWGNGLGGAHSGRDWKAL